ncbi:Chromatin structure-remodeling complex protein SYD [Melia azedarach]|uniref:Chromatin structure-remodeling complex protein SYD n=1 Tax=Melia azedarach TaxID=155640 RepID=A0ACC1YF22_MELAZ|nr:Chromatin structure-remodeling complex protein SYD [Melia azedarach]
MVTQLEHHQQQRPCLDPAERTKSLICALNFISRNLPVPPDVYDAVSSIYYGDQDSDNDVVRVDGGSDEGTVVEKPLQDGPKILNGSDLLTDFENALSKQRSKCMSGFALTESRESHYQSHIQHRLNELEELPSTRGEELQTKCLLELYGLKLAELQSKVRSDVSSEYWLRMSCAFPEKKLFDWGMMRLRRPLYGVGDAFAMEADDHFRKKRDAERLSRLEEEARNQIETKKRKFFAEILNAVREFQVHIQTSIKRRKQRNDGVQAWHGRQRQRATRAEKLRFQALKADDQEAYMRLVKESKNERLTTLLEETNKLLVNLGAAVQRQKDAKLSDGIEPLKDSEDDLLDLDASENGTPRDSIPEEDDIIDSDRNDDSGDLLEGQRQYNSAIHSIEEKVTEQPTLLQGGELRPYQLEGLQWMLSLFNNNLNGILADEMGLGKTIQTIALIAYLLENKGVMGPHVIVAPKAVLPNWINEFSTWAPSIAAVVYDGRPDERKALREEFFTERGGYNVLITHYDLIMRDRQYLKKIHWYYMIVDEGHRLKNHECALAKTIAGYQIHRRLLLTGTPIQNSLQELWSLLNFLLPTIFNSVENFEEWFNAPFKDRGQVALTDEEQLLIIRRLHHVIRPFILRRKKDEVEKYLPGKSQVILKCDMSAWQKVYYQQVTDVGRVGLDTGSGKSKSLQNLSMQLRKCCNHPYLFVGEYNMWRKEEIIRASGKFELLDRLLPKLRRSGHRVLLFSQMTRLMDILEIYLKLNDFKYLRLDGSTKTEERGVLLKQFNAPDSPYFMFLLSTRAGGLGLNLQTADTVIIFDSDWNPQMDQQAEDRAHRIGQKKEVRVFVLVSVGSIEEVILERAKQKMGIDAKVIQAGLFNTTSTAQDRREMLKEIMRRGTSSLGTDVPSEREINRLAARSDEEFWMFEKMDEERRQKENYRSRLMEDHEVPEWAYSAPDNKEDQNKGFEHDSSSITGKRKRKEVVYADTLSDLQWMKAVENGQDISKLSSSSRGKRRDHLPSEGNESASNGTGAERKVLDGKNENPPMVSEGTSEDTFGSAPKRLKFERRNPEDSDIQSADKPEHTGVQGSGLNGHIFTWNTHRKKRSSYVVQTSSSDSRGQNSNGRGNRWT